MNEAIPKPDPPTAQTVDTQRLVAVLRERIAGLEGPRRPEGEAPVASGCGPLDRLLPEGGFRRGTLVEWLAEGDGTGALTLALGTAREALAEGGALVVVDRRREFYAPAAARLGINLVDLILVQPSSTADELWAIDQALRCPGVAAVVAWPERLDGRTFRRLQLAAEEGGAIGLLLRDCRVRHEPTWAEVRMGVEPLPPAPPVEGRRLRIELLRCRGGDEGAGAEVVLDDETRIVHSAPQLARPAADRRAAGA